jgi:quercetin dioxygenase-like cupin family protein
MTFLLALLLAAGMEDVQVNHLNEAKFAPGKLQGVQGAPIAGDPKTEAHIGYSKAEPGAKIPEHWHSYAEYTVLLAGKALLYIDGKPQQIQAGDYFVIPAKTKHAFDCLVGAQCIQLTRRAGPADYNFTQTAAAK